MTLSAWLDDTYMPCPECACCVYYGLDAETACLAPYGDPETTVIVSAKTGPDGCDCLAVTSAKYAVMTVSAK